MTDQVLSGQPANEEWDYPAPFVIHHVVDASDIDELGHTNNVCYLAWLERCAWAHSAAVGFDVKQMLAVNRAMVVRDVRMQYLQATFEHDELYIGDWLSASDGRLRATRTFQILRAGAQSGSLPGKNVTVMRAEVDFVCIDVERGRPTRMPPEFVAAYQPVQLSPK